MGAFKEMYDADVSASLVSQVTDRVIASLEFDGVLPADTGRPAYHPERYSNSTCMSTLTAF